MNTGSLTIVDVGGRCKLKMRAGFFVCKLEVENAVLCFHMEDFSLLVSVRKERIKKTTNRQMTGL